MIALVIEVVIALVIGGAFFMMSKGGKQKDVGIPVKMPELSAVAQAGQSLFQANCARCHGVNVGGTRKGPPLIHKYYEPKLLHDRPF